MRLGGRWHRLGRASARVRYGLLIGSRVFSSDRCWSWCSKWLRPRRWSCWTWCSTRRWTWSGDTRKSTTIRPATTTWASQSKAPAWSPTFCDPSWTSLISKRTSPSTWATKVSQLLAHQPLIDFWLRRMYLPPFIVISNTWKGGTYFYSFEKFSSKTNNQFVSTFTTVKEELGSELEKLTNSLFPRSYRGTIFVFESVQCDIIVKSKKKYREKINEINHHLITHKPFSFDFYCYREILLEVDGNLVGVLDGVVEGDTSLSCLPKKFFSFYSTVRYDCTIISQLYLVLLHALLQSYIPQSHYNNDSEYVICTNTMYTIRRYT